MSKVALLAIGALLFPQAAFAYVGPGAGLGAITAALGLLAAIIMGFFAFLYYPIKRMLKGKKTPTDTEALPNKTED